MSSELIIKDTGVLARAELDTQISTAKAYPRNLNRSMEMAEQLVTMDEETAASCFYSLPRKDKDGTKKEIKGPSIRLAEIIATSWGNLHAATRIIENDGRHITAEGVAWDLETNVKMSAQNKVSIRFGEKDGKGGYTANTDMQTVLSNAASAKALRNAIFKVIPRSLVNNLFNKAQSYVKKSLAKESESDQMMKIALLMDKLEALGVDDKELLKYYNLENIYNITPDIYRELIGLGTAIKEGHIKAKDAFKTEVIEESQSTSDKVDQLISEKKLKKEGLAIDDKK